MFKKSLLKKCFSIRRTVMPFGIILLVVFWGTAIEAGDMPFSEMLYVYEATGDGYYELTAVYEVDPQEALAAFAADPASQDGEGHVFVRAGGDLMKRIGSSNKFTDFLKLQYPMRFLDDCEGCRASTCENGASFTIVWSCYGLNCSPNVECETTLRLLSTTINCFNDPPCAPDSVCEPVSGSIVGLIFEPEAPCHCISAEECVSDDIVDITVLTIGPVCKCVKDWSPPTIPTLSEWGMIIFALLILTLITLVMTRRRKAAMAAEK